MASLAETMDKGGATLTIDDPYAVLGVSPTDAEADIAKAYRRLAKRYHPDLNPGNKAAEEKMKQINAAYDMIKNRDKPGAAGHSGGGYARPEGDGDPFGPDGPFSWFFGGYQRQNTGGQARGGRFGAIIGAINTGQYLQALNALARDPVRDAPWYYYSAVANAGAGNPVTALNHAREAASMEPDNPTYADLAATLARGGETYRQAGQRYGYGMSPMGRGVIQMVLAQLACLFCCRCC
jgi:molecular chaperone DnaJ